MSLPAGTRLGPYEIEASLGAGGMGEVYLARDTRLGRNVAVKVLHDAVSGDPEFRDRFDREARAIAALSHPNICTLFDVGSEGRTRYLVMEHVKGQTLAERLAVGPLPVAEAVRLGAQIADGLAAAHDRRIIHRDLKPANIKLAASGPKILDFGLAKFLAGETPPVGGQEPATEVATGRHVIVGTAPYMSPEQVRVMPVDHRSDVWAFGVVLHEMLTGRMLFRRESGLETLAAILHCDIGIETLPEQTPAAVRSLLQRLLERDRDRRLGDLHQARRILDGAASAAGGIGPSASEDSLITAPGETRVLQAPRDRASIAVLPFDNLSGDPRQEYFADGIVEEIITGLSRIKWLFVISRNSTFIYKGKVVDVTTVGRELGVRYVLRGSVRRSGKHVRLMGQLAEAVSAVHVWADRYDGTLDDVFALQDEMTMSVISAVEPTLRKAEVERARRKRPESLDAYDLFLRALPLATTAMPENADKALVPLEQAIRLEPAYSAAHGLIAWCHEQRYLRAGLRAEDREAALRHAQAAIEAGGDDAMALAMGGFVVGALARNYDTALDALDRSLALSPSSALAFGFSSIVRGWIGDYDTAIEHARTGIRLGPYDPLIYLPYVGLARAHFFAGRFAEAASAAARASAANPRFSVPRYLHTAALICLGRIQEAKALAQVVLELQPGFTISGLISENLTSRERMATLIDALRDAGLPD